MNFIDTSHHNSDAPKHPIDWQRVFAAGIRKTYLKATESTNFKDTAFPRDYPAAKAAGIMRGPYHFFRGDKSGAAQAKWFADYVGADQGEIVPGIDVEAGAEGVTKAQFTLRLHECLLETEERFKHKPSLYTSAVKIQELTTQPAWIAEYKLWLAAPDVPVPPLPAGATEYWIHQYSWAGVVDGIDGAVDLDRENAPPDPTPPADHSAEIRAHAEAIKGLV